MPDLVGRTRSKAQGLLAVASLISGSVDEQYSFTVAQDLVISQSTAAGAQVAQGTAVSYVISLGVQTVIVPDVSGMTQAAAEAALSAAGLSLGSIHQEYIDTHPAGSVIRSHPAAGTLVAMGSAIDLDLSLDVWTGEDTEPPKVSVIADPVQVNLGETVTLTVSASDNAGVTGASLSVNGSSVALTGGQAVYSADMAGIMVAEATATDAAGLSATASTSFVVVDPDDAAAPVVSIGTPGDGSLVTSPLDVTGTVDDPALSQYTLACAPSGTGQWTTLATGTASVTDGVVGRFDPTVLANGLYDILLSAEDYNGNSANDTVTVLVDGQMKLGVNKVSFTDLQVPVAGIDLTIVRTYDSSALNKDDFGKGWSLEVMDVDLARNRVLGDGWYEENNGSFLPNWVVKPGKVHMVVVTFPDGHSDVFDIQAYYTDPVYRSAGEIQVGFVPREGTHSTLQSLDYNLLALFGDVLYDNDKFEPYDPQRFLLTQKDGTRLVIHRDTGLESIEDLNGNTLTIGEGGVTHSSGKSIQFVRDSAGRIEKIIDPRGLEYNYIIDPNGDLVAFTDPEERTATFFYQRCPLIA